MFLEKMCTRAVIKTNYHLGCNGLKMVRTTKLYFLFVFAQHSLIKKKLAATLSSADMMRTAFPEKNLQLCIIVY